MQQKRINLRKFNFTQILTCDLGMRQGPATGPHGGVRGVRWPQILGCCVTKIAPHKAPNLIA